MRQENLNIKAKAILKSNIYLTLATTDGNLPWAAPLFYCLDEKFNFYFISQMDSLHTINILKQSKVSFAIFDSHQKEGEGNGVQWLGTVALLEWDEIIDGLKYYSTSFLNLTPEILSEPAPYRLFKLKPDNFFVLDPDTETDKRVEVYIK